MMLGLLAVVHLIEVCLVLEHALHQPASCTLTLSGCRQGSAAGVASTGTASPAPAGEKGIGIGAVGHHDHSKCHHEDLPEVNHFLASTTQRKQWGLDTYGSAESLGLPCVGRQALTSPEALLAIRKLDMDHMMMALKRTFERWAADGASLQRSPGLLQSRSCSCE
jgi:hypothetical protein